MPPKKVRYRDAEIDSSDSPTPAKSKKGLKPTQDEDAKPKLPLSERVKKLSKPRWRRFTVDTLPLVPEASPADPNTDQVDANAKAPPSLTEYNIYSPANIRENAPVITQTTKEVAEEHNDIHSFGGGGSLKITLQLTDNTGELYYKYIVPSGVQGKTAVKAMSEFPATEINNCVLALPQTGPPQFVIVYRKGPDGKSYPTTHMVKPMWALMEAREWDPLWDNFIPMPLSTDIGSRVSKMPGHHFYTLYYGSGAPEYHETPATTKTNRDRWFKPADTLGGTDMTGATKAMSKPNEKRYWCKVSPNESFIKDPHTNMDYFIEHEFDTNGRIPTLKKTWRPRKDKVNPITCPFNMLGIEYAQFAYCKDNNDTAYSTAVFQGILHKELTFELVVEDFTHQLENRVEKVAPIRVLGKFWLPQDSNKELVDITKIEVTASNEMIGALEGVGQNNTWQDALSTGNKNLVVGAEFGPDKDDVTKILTNVWKTAHDDQQTNIKTRLMQLLGVM